MIENTELNNSTFPKLPSNASFKKMERQNSCFYQLYGWLSKPIQNKPNLNIYSQKYFSINFNNNVEFNKKFVEAGDIFGELLLLFISERIQKRANSSVDAIDLYFYLIPMDIFLKDSGDYQRGGTCKSLILYFIFIIFNYVTFYC